jgi:hypothetical protein
MTDETTWRAPSGGAPMSPPPGAHIPPPQPGWTPPPKPGLIPLRPLAFGTILGASFQVMRRNPRPTFGTAVLFYGVVTLISAGAFAAILAYYLWALTNSASGDNEDFATSDYADFSAGFLAAILIGFLIPVALSVVTSAVLQGIISLEVARGTLGEKLKLRGIWRLARGRIGALIGWSFLLVGILLVVYAIVIAILIAIGTAGGVGGIIAAVVLGFVLFLGLAVLSVWVSTKLSLVPSILMLERLSISGAIRRSWGLTNGFFWKTLGIELLVNFIISTALQIISIPVSLIVGFAATLFNPNGDQTAAIVTIVISYLVLGIVTIVIGSIGLIVESAVVTLIYLDIRMRREGLDLDLLRFVEARQAGTQNLADPFLRVPSVPEQASQQFAAPPQQQPTDSPWT